MVDVLATELGAEAAAHRDTLEELKRRIGVHHADLDCWLYSFLENKKFDINETIAKLKRRAAMEVNELGTHDFSAASNNGYNAREGLSQGFVQIVGQDGRGRICLYVCTARNTPDRTKRATNLQIFDAVMCYITRLRPESKSCRVVLLVNQKDASVLKNIDPRFDLTIALRVSKYYPGLVEKIYIVNTPPLLNVMMKSVFLGLPKDILDRIQVVSDDDVKRGALLQWFDAALLPAALGGTVDDTAQRWREFADTVTEYFRQLQDAVVRGGMSVKEWERQRLRGDAGE